MRIKRQNKGFTLLEILLVIATIGILASIVLVAINPNRQIEAARNAKRRADINTITKAIQQYSIDNNGQYPAGIETGAKTICRNGTPEGCIDLSILAPTYIASIPESDSNYYYVRRSNNNIEVSHPRDDIWNIGGNPSLDLNFAKNKSLIDNVSGKNLVDFSRNSIGTYIGEDGLIKTAGINKPRFDHNPVTGESLGLLVEEQRTNLVLNSESSSSWGVQGGSVTNNTDVAPNGEMTADTFTGNSGSFRELQLNFPVTSGVVYSASIFLKGDGIVNWRAEGTFGVGLGSGPFLNLQTGGITGGAGYSNVTATRYQNGWWQLTWTRTATSTGNGGVRLTLYDHTAVQSYKVWGMQFENGSFPTSYIPTSGAAVTRQVDNVSISGNNFSNFFNTSRGTFFADYKSTSPINARILNFGTGATSTIISNEGVIGSGAHFSSIGNIAGAASNGVKVAATTSISESAGAFNGNTAVSTGTTSYYAGANSLNFIPNISGAPIKQNWLKRITYWPTRLPNSTLQALTQ